MKKIPAIFLFWMISNSLLAQQNIPFVVSGNTIDSDLSGYLFTAKNLQFKEGKDLIFQKKFSKN